MTATASSTGNAHRSLRQSSATRDRAFISRPAMLGVAMLVALGGASAGCQLIVGIGETTRAPCDPMAPFGPAMLANDLNPRPGYQEHVHLSSDELTAYLSITQDTWEDSRLYRTTRASRTSPFGDPQPATDLESADDRGELAISVTKDGKTAFFDGLTNDGKTVIYRATRASAAIPFSTPQPIDISMTLTPPPRDSFVLPDGSALYYTLPSSPPVFYRSALNGPTIGEGVPIALPSNFTPYFPVVSGDELTLFLSSDTPPLSGQADIWMAKRKSTTEPFGDPVNLSNVNTGDGELPQWISGDGCRLYLMRFSAGTTFNPINVYMAERPPP